MYHNRGLLFIAGLLFYTIFLHSILLSQTQTCDITEKDQLEYIIKIYAPEEDAFIAVQKLTRNLINKRDFRGAANIYETYRNKFPALKDRIDKIVALLLAPEKNIKMTNIGGAINTQFPEYGPVLTPDMKRLFFTGRDREDGYGGEDIYVSEFRNNAWQIAKPLGKYINTESNEYINSISADGNIMVLFGNYLGDLGRGDNFYAEKTPKGWSNIKHYPPPINSIYWDADAFLTADGKAILFSSERPSGVSEFKMKGECWHDMYWGNTDIWIVERNDDGSWNKQAINLGPNINTPYTERTPFLHPDGKTLYFSSDGHYGIGKSDVFRSVRLSDTSWTLWSDPVNLGCEINTAGEDWGYKITTDGKQAYFSTSSNISGFGSEDVYYIDLPVEVKPEKEVFTINGKVVDENGKPIDANIKWEDVKLDKEVGIAHTDPQTGEYFIALPVGRHYAYYAEIKGYYSDIHYLDLTDEKMYSEVKADVNVISIEQLKNTGKSIKIEHIFFDFNKYELKEESFQALNRLVKFMNDNQEISIDINAHTDDKGSDTYNHTLSEKRASSVVNYLIQKGISNDRLFPHGFGESMPIATNDTEEGRALNRRVEFRLIKNK
jgi:outer membrane protein OmpA-like peptidoglycan-associated protein